MARRPADGQVEFDFPSIIEAATVQGRPDPAGDSPIDRTVAFMRRLVQSEEAWGTTMARARRELLAVDPRCLYFDMLKDYAGRVRGGGDGTARYGELLEAVGVRGFGMPPSMLRVIRPQNRRGRWRVEMDEAAVRNHLRHHIVGDGFLIELVPQGPAASEPGGWVGASDVSQHVSKVPLPSKFFHRSVPFVLNNAAGTLFRVENGGAKFDPLLNPHPNADLLDWMLIDPSYEHELEGEDYRRVLGSAMDVGQYQFDLTHLLKSDRRPGLILRDGSLFPQDAYHENFMIPTRRGKFTRQAVRELLDCLIYAQETGTIYCGVAKQVRLQVYAAALDWYIETQIDEDWAAGATAHADGAAMTLLLASPEFPKAGLDRVVATCLIRRSFTTRANLNVKSSGRPILEYLDKYSASHTDFDLAPYRRLCEIGHVCMLFIGHSRSPQQLLPRYEFFQPLGAGNPLDRAARVLGGLRECSLTVDHDHAFLSDDPIAFLLPEVTQQAHRLCKDVGKHIDRSTGQWIMSEYRKMLRGDGGA